MTGPARIAALLCVASVSAACGGGGTSLDQDYSGRFVGSWGGTLTVTARGEQTSNDTVIPISRTAANALALDGFCPDGAAAPALVTAPDRLTIQPFTCAPVPTSGCSAVTVRLASGSGVLTGKTLALDLSLNESGCGMAVDIGLHFVGTLPDRAPVVSVTLSPAQPQPTDDLVADATATDPDGDPVTLSYAWQLDGSTVAGQTAATLPAGTAGLEDVVTVTVTASDGTLSSTATASVTMPGFTFTTDAPAEAAYGAPLTFHVSASPAGAAGDYYLAYGPAGMAVSSDGTVTWTPRQPMFDRTLDVHYAVGTTHVHHAQAAGTIRVTDPTRAQPIFRTGFDPPGSAATLRVSPLDGDGRAEALMATSRTGVYELARSGSGYEERWALPFPPDGTTGEVTAVTSADLDGDGREELFLALDETIVQLDGATRREVARAAMPGATCVALAVADLEPDGHLELVCLARPNTSYGDSSDGALMVYDAATLVQRWSTATITALGGTLAIGNVDHDPALEIVTSGGYVFDGATGKNEWAYAGGFGAYVGVGDLDGHGVGEIVGAEAWGAFAAYSAITKTQLWQSSRFNIGALTVTDIDADGVAEILVGDAQWGDLTAFRYDPSSNGLTTVFDLAGQGNIRAIGVGDLDGDGANEFVFGSDSVSDFGATSLVIAGRNPGIGLEWLSQHPAQLDGPFLGARLARLGGGARALLFAVPSTDNGYDGTRLLALDPVAGVFTLSAELGSNWNRQAALDVGDYDHDGVDEAFLATSELYNGYMVAYDYAAARTEWTAPTTQNQDGVAVRVADLNGDAHADVVEMASDGAVRAYDVANQTLIWQGPGLTHGADVAVADLDGSGTPAIVAAANGKVIVYGAVAGPPAGYAQLASADVPNVAALLVADTDGDGVPEIYALSVAVPGIGPATVYCFDATLTPTRTLTVEAGAQSIFLEDLGAGRKNLVLGVPESALYSSPGTRPYLVAIDPIQGAEVWRSPALWGAVPRSSLSYLVLNEGGEPQLAFGTTRGMYVTR